MSQVRDPLTSSENLMLTLRENARSHSTVRFIMVCSLLFLSIALASVASAITEAVPVSQEVQDIVSRIEKINMLMGEAVGFAGARPEQYDNFMDLTAVATADELVSLTNHSNGVVRAYAFWGLFRRNSVDLLPLVVSHLEDTKSVNSQFGCTFGKTKVADFLVGLITQECANWNAAMSKSDTLPSRSSRTDSLCQALERKMVEQSFPQDILLLFAEDYASVRKPEEGDNQLNTIQNGIEMSDFRGFVKETYHYLRGRKGRQVKDYQGEIFGRVNVAVWSADNKAISDSLWHMVLQTMYIQIPLQDTLPLSAKSPPTVLIKTPNSIVLVRFRCEDFLTSAGIQDEQVFWSKAEKINALITWFQPEWVLACSCGGQVRVVRHN